MLVRTFAGFGVTLIHLGVAALVIIFLQVEKENEKRSEKGRREGKNEKIEQGV